MSLQIPECTFQAAWGQIWQVQGLNAPLIAILAGSVISWALYSLDSKENPGQPISTAFTSDWCFASAYIWKAYYDLIKLTGFILTIAFLSKILTSKEIFTCNSPSCRNGVWILVIWTNYAVHPGSCMVWSVIPLFGSCMYAASIISKSKLTKFYLADRQVYPLYLLIFQTYR